MRQGAEGIVTNCGLPRPLPGRAGGSARSTGGDVEPAAGAVHRAAAVARPPGRHPHHRGRASECGALGGGRRRPDTPIAGTPPDEHFVRAILDDGPALEPLRCEAEVVEAARARGKRSEVGALVLECTNMCPYSRAVRRRLDLPVFDMLSLIAWFQQGLRPPVHPPFD
ncbi:MAG: hypothetical protein R3C69_18745 [Geminicoccaceae bacterium]